MSIDHSAKKAEKTPSVYYRDGKIYFSRKVERGFYFFLTMLVLIWGVLMKLGEIG